MIVYLIRNTVNGKCYIGKTTRSLSWRWTQHRCEARLGRLKSPLYEDMRTYQPHCFQVEILGEASTQRRISQMERKFIRIFDTVKNGYNAAACSYGGRTRYTRGSLNRTQSPETIRKIREQNLKTYAERKNSRRRGVATGKEVA